MTQLATGAVNSLGSYYPIALLQANVNCVGYVNTTAPPVVQVQSTVDQFGNPTVTLSA